MIPDEAVHLDVAAYALGALDTDDAAEFEEHLAACARCAEELEALLPTVALLSHVDIDALHAAERSRMDEELWRLVAAERARTSRRRALTLVAGVVVSALAAAGSMVAGAALAGGDPPVAAPGPTTPPATTVAPSPSIGETGAGGALPDGARYSATDTDTGVSAELVLTGRVWGTQVSFTISALTGPRTCRLLVVHADGTAEVTGTWRVPETGYGTEAHPEPLLLQAATSAQLAEIDRVQVQSLDDSGEITTLVTVPIAS